MTCNDVQPLLTAFLDDELDLATSLQIEQHLTDCPDCQRQLEVLRTVSAAAANPQIYQPAPAALAEKLRHTIHSQTAAQPTATVPKPRRAQFSKAVWIAPSLAAAILLIVTPILFLSHRDNTQMQIAEVVGSHVRSLQANHLLDVVSTDQHTVHPWFNGKLDFSPPVVDLAAKGYPLIGGRLDYLDNHRAAALVYRHGKHVINLLLWPGNTTPLTTTSDGFNIIRFQCNGMVCWAISDLNEQDLRAFTQLFANQQPPSSQPGL